MSKESLTCRVCAKPMKRSRSSLPQGEATCRGCRRSSPPRPKDYAYKKSLTCCDCGEPMWRGSGSRAQGRACCRPCRRARRKPGYAILARGFCAHCAHWYESTGKATRFCSIQCANAAKPSTRLADYSSERERNSMKCQRRRARKMSAVIEEVIPSVVFERDNWTCQLCGEPVDPSMHGWNRMGATLDHIVPLAAGGLHCYANIQLAHRSCNSSKGARLVVLTTTSGGSRGTHTAAGSRAG